MELEFRASFIRDLRRVRDHSILGRVSALIEELEAAERLADISNAARIRSDQGRYYRFRIGDYRVGAVLEGQMLTLVRILHRRDIYRYFP